MAKGPIKARWTRGDTLALWRAPLIDPFSTPPNQPLELTGLTVKLRAKPEHGGSVLADITGDNQSPSSAGIVQFDCSTIAAGADSLYRCQFIVTDSNGKVQRNYGEDFFHSVKDAL